MPAIVAIAIALAAVAVAVAAWFRPAPEPEAPAPKAYSAQEVADAKKAVCEAYAQVRKTVNAAGGKSGDNPTDSFVVAINTRTALATSSSFLRANLAENPATPPPLSEAVRDLADRYEEIAMNQLADATTSDLAPLATSADQTIDKINKACG